MYIAIELKRYLHHAPAKKIRHKYLFRFKKIQGALFAPQRLVFVMRIFRRDSDKQDACHYLEMLDIVIRKLRSI